MTYTIAMTICSGPSPTRGLLLETEYMRQLGSTSLTRLAKSDASAIACKCELEVLFSGGAGGRERLGIDGTFEEDRI
jgi:hypothetical protein